MLDNPCLIRSKDGLTLIADFPNSQCYAQKATTSQIYAQIDTYGQNKGNISNYSSGTPYDKCFFIDTWFNIGTSDMSNIPSWNSTLDCNYWKTEYYADSGWTKINNSIQEYREDF